MEPLASSSFIPKKTFVSSVPPPKRSASNLFALLATVIFILSLLLYGGVFGYTKFLEQQIATLNDSLDKQQDAFDSETLISLAQTDNKLIAAKEVLKNHTTLIPLFDLLADATLQSVRFKSFKFRANPDARIYDISMSGEARSYASIALQSDSFVDTKKLKDIVFSDLNIDQSGRVVFGFSATVDPSLISYEQLIAAQLSSGATE